LYLYVKGSIIDKTRGKNGVLLRKGIRRTSLEGV